MPHKQYPSTIITSSDLDDGQCLEFLHEGQRGLLIRHQGQAYAYLNRCAHQPKPLTDTGNAFDADGQLLTCQQHQAVFTPTNGQCITGPCIGKQLTSIPIIEQDEQILLLGWPRHV